MDAKQSTPNVFFGFPPEILSALDREIKFIGRIVDHELEQCAHESPESRNAEDWMQGRTSLRIQQNDAKRIELLDEEREQRRAEQDVKREPEG